MMVFGRWLLGHSHAGTPRYGRGPRSSRNRYRHRLALGGNRQLNRALLHDRHGPGALVSGCTGVPGAQAWRRKDRTRSATLPEAASCQRRLPSDGQGCGCPLSRLRASCLTTATPLGASLGDHDADAKAVNASSLHSLLGIFQRASSSRRARRTVLSRTHGTPSVGGDGVVTDSSQEGRTPADTEVAALGPADLRRAPRQHREDRVRCLAGAVERRDLGLDRLADVGRDLVGQACG